MSPSAHARPGRRGAGEALLVGERSLPPLAVGAADAARLVGVSKAHWHRLVGSGRAPHGVRLGGRVVWPVRGLEAWLAAGAPTRDAWAAQGGQGGAP